MLFCLIIIMGKINYKKIVDDAVKKETKGEYDTLLNLRKIIDEYGSLEELHIEVVEKDED